MLDRGASRRFCCECYGISYQLVSQIAKKEYRTEDKPQWIYSLPPEISYCLQRADIKDKEQLYAKIEKGHFGIRHFGDKKASELNKYLDRKIKLGKPIRITKKYGNPAGFEHTYLCKEILFWDGRDDGDDWKDIPAEKMTKSQLKKAVKELRKELAIIKGL